MKYVFCRLVDGKLLAGVAMALLLCALPARASLVSYDFESFDDLTPLSGQISGLTFTNATVLKAGFSLNELSFPPNSGANVVFDDGGAITIDFDQPVFGIAARFTYLTTLTLSIFDDSHAELGRVTSAFASNEGAGAGSVGSSPNDHLALTNLAGRISRLTITGNLAGGSFVLDDLTVDTGNSVPEPSTFALAALLLGICGAHSRKVRSVSKHVSA